MNASTFNTARFLLYAEEQGLDFEEFAGMEAAIESVFACKRPVLLIKTLAKFEHEKGIR